MLNYIISYWMLIMIIIINQVKLLWPKNVLESTKEKRNYIPPKFDDIPNYDSTDDGSNFVSFCYQFVRRLLIISLPIKCNFKSNIWRTYCTGKENVLFSLIGEHIVRIEIIFLFAKLKN